MKTKQNRVEKAPAGVTFTLDSIRWLGRDVFLELVDRRLEQLDRQKEIKVGWRTFHPRDELYGWFKSLPPEIFADFFEATEWPPKEAEKEREAERERKASMARRSAKAKATPDHKRRAKVASANPRAKRSKTKAELAELRKSKRADKADRQPSLPFRNDGTPIVAVTKDGTPIVAVTKEPRPKRATGDQLAADGVERERLLEFLKTNPNVSASTIQSECTLTEGQTKGLLRRLREQGAIRVDGKNRGARYSITMSNGAAAHP